jgi:hypothetical protein
MASQRARNDYLAAVSNSKYLKDKYGGSVQHWKNIHTASLIGAEVSDSYAKWANESLQVNSIEARQSEVASRAELSIANIFAESEKVQAVQKGAFQKAGVKLEGSALNVLRETAMQATEAAQVRQLEADFENTQMEVQRRMLESRIESAPMDFIMNVGYAYALGQAK